MSTQAICYVSFIHLPNTFLDHGPKGQEMVTKNFEINLLYGLVSFKYF